MLTHPQTSTAASAAAAPRAPRAPSVPQPAATEGGNLAIEFTPSHFDRVAALIYQRAGISLHRGKSSLVYNRLARRVRASDSQNFSNYLAQLDNPHSAEWEHFVNALTTNLTAFFRETHHFPLLADYLKTLDPARGIRIWCTAASTGEEPYTIAITVREALGRTADQVRIIATDIDTTVLKTASAGAYDAEAVQKMNPTLMHKYFLRGTGERAGMVKVRDSIRDLISFRQVNLLADKWPPFERFDVIFCRNVMIYFDKPTQARILERFAPLMHPGALFFAGHSETVPAATGVFTLRGKSVYARTAK